MIPKKLRNWIAAGFFALASAGLTGLESKVSAQVYDTPNGRVAVDGRVYEEEHWEEIHPGKLQPEYNGRRSINYNGIKIKIPNESSVRIEDRSKHNLIPLITTRGFFNIKPGKIAELDYTDRNIGVVADDSGDFLDSTPAFQLIPQDAEGRQLGNKDVYFCDNHGHVYFTSMRLVNDVWNGKPNVYRLYDLNRGDNTALYYPTRDFACLKPHEKDRFWDNTSHFDQLSLRGATANVLRRFSR
ncbi:MAG: hypothetical protein RL557_457 [archaeon]|jgi:hypothetical protein